MKASLRASLRAQELTVIIMEKVIPVVIMRTVIPAVAMMKAVVVDVTMKKRDAAAAVMMKKAVQVAAADAMDVTTNLISRDQTLARPAVHTIQEPLMMVQNLILPMTGGSLWNSSAVPA